MTNLWSGPSRALHTHVDLFARVDAAHTWVKRHGGPKGVTPTEIDRAPTSFQQRLKLMTSMADNLGIVVQPIFDGSSITTQPDDHRALYTEHNLARGVGLVNAEWDILKHGETHYIARHIMDTVAAAADQCGDEPLFPTDLPCPQGLMVFEHPLIIPDLHPDTGETVPDLEMPVRAIAWGLNEVHCRKQDSDEMEVLGGIFYTLYTDDEAWRTIFLPSVKAALPDIYVEHGYMYEENGQHADRLWCIDTSGWAFAKQWKRSDTDSPRFDIGQGEIHKTVAYVRRFILAMFRFEWQRILVPQVHRPSRPEARRALRAGLPLQDGYIKVIRLRRHVEAEARGETLSEIAHDHAWVVRGHPRRQWFPSLGPARTDDGDFNVDSHRLIWIDPHVKGNPDGPLVIGHAVTAVIH